MSPLNTYHLLLRNFLRISPVWSCPTWCVSTCCGPTHVTGHGVSSYLSCSGHNWLLCDFLRIWFQAQRDDYQGWCVLYGSVSSVQLLWYHYTTSGNWQGFHAEVDVFACPTTPLELQLFAPTTHFFFVVSPNQQLKRRVHGFLDSFAISRVHLHM